MSNPPRRPRTLNDARTEAEAAFKRATSCKSLYRCLSCKEPFEHFKCH